MVSLAVVLSGCAINTYAQGSAANTSNSIAPTTPSQLKEQQAQQLKTNLQRAAQRKETIEQKLTQKKENLETRVASREAAMEKRVENRVMRLEERMELKKERVASKEAQLIQKLGLFKDQKKAALAEKVNTNLNQINERRSTMMQEHLKKMSDILTKLEERVTQSGKILPSDAQVKIAEARANISTAEGILDAQVDKDYTITVSTESKIREDATKVKTSLSTDLQATHLALVTAKQSVSDAISFAISSLEGANNEQ